MTFIPMAVWAQSDSGLPHEREWFLLEAPRLLSQSDHRELQNVQGDTASLGAFVERFWRRHGEHRALFEERTSYANTEFGTSTVPGWRTDRGRVWALYGPPDQREIPQMGDGGGFADPYPFEIWTYRAWPARGEERLEFVDPTMTNDYRLQNPWEKLPEAFGQYTRISLRGLESVPEGLRDRLRERMNTFIATQIGRDWRRILERRTTEPEPRLIAFEPREIVVLPGAQWSIWGCALLAVPTARPWQEKWVTIGSWEAGDWQFSELSPAVHRDAVTEPPCPK